MTENTVLTGSAAMHDGTASRRDFLNLSGRSVAVIAVASLGANTTAAHASPLSVETAISKMRPQWQHSLSIALAWDRRFAGVSNRAPVDEVDEQRCDETETKWSSAWDDFAVVCGLIMMMPAEAAGDIGLKAEILRNDAVFEIITDETGGLWRSALAADLIRLLPAGLIAPNSDTGHA